MIARFASALLALATVAAAQIPVDSTAIVGFRDVTLNRIVDPVSKQSQQITGLSSLGAQVNSVAVDPVTGLTYVGNLVSNLGEVRLIVLNQSKVILERVIATFGRGENVNALDFDGEGNLFAATCGGSRGFAIYRIERGTNKVVRWDTETYGGAFNALTIDRQLGRMWVGVWGGAAGTILEYDLSTGPGKGKTVLSMRSIGESTQISGLAHDGKFGLYIANFARGRGLVYYNLLTKQKVVDTGQPSAGLADVDYDERDGSVHFLTNGGLGYYRIARFGANKPAQVVHTRTGVGLFSHLWVNDLRARTSAFPLAIDVTKGGVLELAGHGGGNRPAIVYISSVNNTTIPALQIAGGRTSTFGYFTVPRITVPANLGRAKVGFRSATLTGANRVEIGSEVRVDFR